MQALVASVLLAAVAMAQDRGACAAAAVLGCMGIDTAPALSCLRLFRDEQGVAAPRALGSGVGEGGAGGIWGESDFQFARARTTEELVGATYMALHSPDDRFGNAGTVEETTSSFGHDRSGSRSEVVEGGLQSSVVLAFELDGRADRVPGNVAIQVEDQLSIYAKLGIEPSFSLGQVGDIPVTLAMPLTMGFRLRNYYEDVDGRSDLFAFLDVGAVASAPLPFLPSRGPWHAELGLHWLLLGDSNEQRHAGETTEMIVSIGLVTNF